MGKSDKKIKSDAINALRKKYEAFLEQDRKRKERNEYILGILDKMRSCSALVQHKSNPLGEIHCSVLPKSFVPTQESLSNQDAIYSRCPRDFTMNVTSRNEAENIIISDLLNKYILIPKRKHNYEENPSYDNKPMELKTNNQDNTDWKSKYEILNQLKQKEKEELDPPKDSCGVRPDINKILEEPNRKTHINKPTSTASAQIQPPIDYGQDLPEKDISDNKLRDDVKKHIEYNEIFSNINDFVTDPRKVDESELLVDKRQLYLADTNFGYSQDVSPNKQHVTEPKTKHSVPEAPLLERNNDVTNVDSGRLDYEPPITEPNKDTTYEENHKVEYSTKDSMDSIVVPQSQAVEQEKQNYNYTDDVQYPIDVIDVEKFTPNNDVILKDGVNINPEGYGMNQSHFKEFSETVVSQQSDNGQQEQQFSNEHDQQQYSNVHDQQQYSNEREQLQYSTELDQLENPQANDINQQINDETTAPVTEHVDDQSNPTVDEFEAEQKIFYQDPVEGDVTYSEEGANMYETQNENYQQNGQYYYEAPHEQTYPAEINEHEETSQEYDPAYAQQYLNTQGDEYHQQGNEQPDQQYTHQEGYEPVPVAYDQQYEEQPQAYEQYNQEYYDQQQYQQENYETVQQTEQQLNNEESIVQNEETNKSEQVVEEAVNQDQPEQALDSAMSTIRAN